MPQDNLPGNSPEARGRRFQDRVNQARQLRAARTPPSESQEKRVEASADSAPLVPDRPWLTVEEASVYSGLPASYLLRQIEDGCLAAIDVGIRPGGRYRVARRDLDTITAPTPQCSAGRRA